MFFLEKIGHFFLIEFPFLIAVVVICNDHVTPEDSCMGAAQRGRLVTAACRILNFRRTRAVHIGVVI